MLHGSETRGLALVQTIHLGVRGPVALLYPFNDNLIKIFQLERRDVLDMGDAVEERGHGF